MPQPTWGQARGFRGSDDQKDKLLPGLSKGYVVGVLFPRVFSYNPIFWTDCKIQKMMDYPLTNAGKSAMAPANRSWWQTACALLLCLTCGAASAQAIDAFMDAALSGRGFLPAEDPYCSGGNPRFLGENPQSTDLCTPVVASIATATAFTGRGGITRYSGVVDWVLVELRDTEGDASSAVGSTIIARKPGLLLSNGRVVDAATWQERSSEDRNRCLAIGSGTPLEDDNTCPDLTVEGAAISGNLYVVVRHRNHLDIMSSVAVPAAGAAGDTYIYDFSSNVGAALNSGQKVVFGQVSRARQAGVAMMLAGDVSHRNQSHNLVRFDTDYGDIVLGQSGYLESDVNMDGAVNPVDDLLDILTSNLGTGTQVPE